MQDTRQQVMIVILWLPLILIGAFGAAGLTYVVVSDQPKVYEATARLAVNPGQDPTVQNLELAASAATRYADQALSRSVIEAVIEDMGSTETFGDLTERISSDAVPETLEVAIAARDAEPAAAQLLATALAEELRKRVRDALITDEVKKADDAIADGERYLRTLEARFDQLRRKAIKTQEERNELIFLAGDLSGLRQDIQSLRPSSSAFVRNRLDWFERPMEPVSPVEPRPLYTSLLALVVGGMLAVAVAFLLEYLRRYNKVRDERDLEAASGLPAVGTVLEKRGDIKRGGTERLVMLRYPRSKEAESYRALLAGSGSPGTWDGPSWWPARTHPTAGASWPPTWRWPTRRRAATSSSSTPTFDSPRLHTYFGVPNDRGVTNVLVDRDAPLPLVIVPTAHPRLRLMPAGPPPPRLSGPLGEHQADAMLDALLQVADVVVIDAPPIVGSLDAAVLATKVNEAVLVVPSDTRADDAAEAVRVLRGSRANVVGAILYRRVRGAHKRPDAAPVPEVPPGRALWPSTPPAQPRSLPAVVATRDPAISGARPSSAPNPAPVPGSSPQPAAWGPNPSRAAPPRPTSGPPSAPFQQTSPPLQHRGAQPDR